jgi:chromosome segregation ATPase
VKPSVDLKEIDRRRNESLRAYQERVKELTDKIRSLESRRTTLQTDLETSYNSHKQQVDWLYDKLKQQQETFNHEKRLRETAFDEQQRKIDAQRADLDTERISIAADRADLVEKENQLTAWAHEVNGQQQIIENDKAYVQSIETANHNERLEIEAARREAHESIQRCNARKNEILRMEKDLADRIKDHDARLAEAKAEIEKLSQAIEQYRHLQAEVLIAQNERQEFDAAVEKNRQYAVTLAQWDASIKDREDKIIVREKAQSIREADLKQRLNNVKTLERSHIREGGNE